MRKIGWLWVLILLIPAVACTQSSITPTPTTEAKPMPIFTPLPVPTITPVMTITPSPSPTPAPDYNEVLRLINFYVMDARNEVINLTAPLHTFQIIVAGQSWDLQFNRGLEDAVGYMKNAHSLSSSGKLEVEFRPRDISKTQLLGQILSACQAAYDSLNNQIKYSFDAQEYYSKYLKDETFAEKERYVVRPTVKEKERGLERINNAFETYRKDFSVAIGKLETVLSFSKYLPKQQN